MKEATAKHNEEVPQGQVERPHNGLCYKHRHSPWIWVTKPSRHRHVLLAILCSSPVTKANQVLNLMNISWFNKESKKWKFEVDKNLAWE